jgi:glycerol-1-phosphate dehydrogenase [NAD(P)+]
MLGPASRPAVFHGEQVGVTTLSVARLQHKLLAERPVFRPDTLTDDALRAHYGEELAGSVIEEFGLKRLDQPKADRLNDLVATRWDAIRTQVGAVLLPVARIEAVLKAAGAPTTPEAIHLDRGFYEQAVGHAREIRNRFTVLDALASSGRLQPLLGSI